MIEKKTVDKSIIDPVANAKRLADYGGENKNRYRFVCICGKHVIWMCARNGKERNGEDAYVKVTNKT